MEIKKFKKIISGLLIACLCLFVIGTFFDWQISNVLVGHFTLYGKFFEVFGLLPLTIVRLIVIIYFAYMINVTSKFKTWILRIPILYYAVKVCFLGLITTGVMGMYEMTGDYAMIGTKVQVMSIILAMIIVILMYRYATTFKRERIKGLYMRMIMAYVCTIIVNHEVEFIKTHVGRTRYYAVIANEGAYTPWYHINGLTDNNDFMSFISGHTTSGYMAVLLGFLVPYDKQKLARKLYISGFIFGLLVAFSRIVLGQHFVTDTMGSMLLMSLTIYGLMYVFSINIDGSDLLRTKNQAGEVSEMNIMENSTND